MPELDTQEVSSLPSANHLERRKGGGGHGSSGGGHGSSSGGKGGGSSGSSSKSSSSKSLPNSGGRSYSTKSTGGGKPYTLPKSTVFAGRQAGGGTRTQVYGSYYYGSGYPYGGYGYWVQERPLPYTFWPIPVYANGEYGSKEYGPAYNSSRPGGSVRAATLTSPDRTQVYRILGDSESIYSMLQSLNTSTPKCGAIQGVSYAFDPVQYFDASSPVANNSRPRPEEIIQYYRASSFALSLDGYNNTMALASNAPSSNSSAPPTMSPTPLPSNLNTTFLSCLNTTIGNNLPIVNPQPRFSKGAVDGIVIGSVFGFILLLVLIYKLCQWEAFWRVVTCAPCRRKQKYVPIDKQSQVRNEVHTSEVPNSKVSV